MTRTVPGALQTHLNAASTTTCRLLKIKANRPTDSSEALVFGLCTLDVNVDYDDGSGDGLVSYIATNGFDPTAIAADVSFSVANGEAYALISESVPGVDEETIRRGVLDDAQWVCYLVNFEDLTDGHVILGAGDVGEIRVRYGVLWMPELLDYAVRLKQPIGGVDSRICRAIYGSDPSSQTGCGVNVSGLWVTGTVSSVGAETDQDFFGSAIPSLPSSNYPSRVQFLTGDNAAREYAVEEVDSSGIRLLEPTNWPIQVGDTYRIRRDCQKRYQEDCIALNANGINFKGEPYIPVGDALQGQTPAAQLPGGGGSKFTT